MFSGCTSLKTAPALPAETLAEGCYSNMFNGCTSLETAPALPAKTLTKQCYDNMFYKCTSLKTAPEMKPETLAEKCCYQMFRQCNALETAPELPAKTLAKECYYEMFNTCVKLKGLKVGFTEWGTFNATYNWLKGNAGKGATNPTFECPAELDAETTRDNSHVPSWWTIKKIEPDYLCFTAGEAGAKVSLMKADEPTPVTIQYTTDEGANWTTVDFSSTMTTSVTLANVGDKVYFRNANEAKDVTGFSTDDCNYYYFIVDSVSVSGNIMSLVDKKVESTTIPCDYCFYYLFNGCRKLTSVADLKLPATTLTTGCYASMFEYCTAIKTAPELKAEKLAESCYDELFLGCESLTTAPELPATELAESCYSNMFYNCVALNTAPELPAETLSDYCYCQMFSGCSSLETAPALKAETMVTGCYDGMFNGCKKLTTAPELKSTALADFCYNAMFADCTALKTAPALPATTLTNSCYQSMFNGCSSLETAPELKAETMAKNCYNRMFIDCASLKTAPELPAETLADFCYNYMFHGCTALETAPELPATTLAKCCYAYMFYGCKKLNSVKVGFTKWGSMDDTSANDYHATYNWLYDAGTEATGTPVFECPTELDAETTRDNHHVPAGWTIKKPAVIIDDTTPYDATEDKENVTVTYKRKFNEVGKYEALYLPFSVTMTNELLDQVTIAKIYMVSTKGSVVGGAQDAGVNVVVVKTLGEGESTMPHTPYFIRSEADTDLEFTQEGTTLYASTTAYPGHIDCSTTMDQYDFIGTYIGETLTPQAGSLIYIMQNGGLKNQTTSVTLPCNRWKMVKTPRTWTETPVSITAQPKMQIITLGEDDTTGIIGLDARLRADSTNDAIYTPAGVAVRRHQLTPGMYIQHGKKFIVK